MSNSKKFLNIHENVLIEWIYDNGTISENYSIWTNLKDRTKNYTSESNNNNIEYSLFNIDPVLKKYARVDVSKFNFLKQQDYFTPPVKFDKINIYFPFNFDFNDQIGFLLKISTYDFENKEIIYFSNYFYDKTDINIEKLMQLNVPFRYGDKQWGKYLTISIPSIEQVSDDRIINSSINKPKDNSINYNISPDNNGISTSMPIFIDFSYITNRETVLDITNYYLGDTYNVSISKSPDFQSLGVTVKESEDWDFFEIYGFYNNSNENLDNFVRDMEEKGRKINIEYIITLFEENLQSGYPIKFLVTTDFTQKIEYRPIFKYSNTTAAIDVEMRIIDLVDNTTIIRNTSLGLTKNLFKYGKKLSRLQIDNLNKPKIYNYRSDNMLKSNTPISSTNSYGVTKVPYPLLVDNYKILLNGTNTKLNKTEYKTLGTLTLLLTPFDNIVKFKIARQLNNDGTPEIYDMAEILSNSKLVLIFRSDSEKIEREIFHESDDNDVSLGTFVFKVYESDMIIIKRLKEIDDNFYLTLVSNDTKTLLYSGKYKIYEDVKFLNDDSTYIIPSKDTKELKKKKLRDRSTMHKAKSTKRFLIDERSDSGSQFNESNLPNRHKNHENELDYYNNLIIYMKQGISNGEKVFIKTQLEKLGLSVYYEYEQTFVLERVHIKFVSNIETIDNIDNIIKLKLNLGWSSILPPTPIPLPISLPPINTNNSGGGNNTPSNML